MLLANQLADIFISVFLFYLFFLIQSFNLCFLLSYLLEVSKIYFFKLTINSIIFNVSILSCFLNITSSLLSHLLQIIARTSVLLKVHDILEFKNFQYLLHLMQYMFFVYVLNKFISTFYICH